MKKRKTILKGGVVLLIAVALFLSITVSADTVKEINELQMDSSCIKTTNQNLIVNPVQSALGPTLFLQSPYPPGGYWLAYTSDINSIYLCYDYFEGVNEPICDINWWGVVGYWTGSNWIYCDCEGMLFEIWFYTDDNGQPGVPVCVYTDVNPVCTYYGDYDGWTGYEWSTCLDPCCQLTNGWVSIRGSWHPDQCWFLWMCSPDGDHSCLQEGYGWRNEDLAFELTGEGVPAICCNPVGMNFGQAPAGSTVKAHIDVCNCGEPCSFLNWYIDTTNVPTWGSWTFSPASGTGVPEGACDIVNVTCKLTDTRDNYTGNIYIYNADDPSDFCTIGTSVDVPRTRTAHNPILWGFLQQFPALYLLLKIIFRA